MPGRFEVKRTDEKHEEFTWHIASAKPNQLNFRKSRS